MKKNKDVSREDWEKMAAKLNKVQQVSTDLYTVFAISLGVNHPCTQRARTIHKKTTYLCLNMQQLAAENAKNMFHEKELDRLFPHRGKPAG